MDWKEMLGQLREDPSLPAGEDSPVTEDAAPAKSGKKEKLHVVTERKGRKGKVATIIEGFKGSDEEVAAVAATLKKRLGVGGSSRGGEILIQGDLADKVRDALKTLGYD